MVLYLLLLYQLTHRLHAHPWLLRRFTLADMFASQFWATRYCQQNHEMDNT